VTASRPQKLTVKPKNQKGHPENRLVVTDCPTEKGGRTVQSLQQKKKPHRKKKEHSEATKTTQATDTRGGGNFSITPRERREKKDMKRGTKK